MPVAQVMPGAEPFFHKGGAVGALLCHGFTGSPQSLRPWAEYLAAHGLIVSLPLLPGHGTTWRDMARTTSQDWYAAAERALGDLSAQCGEVFVMGLSLGACIALRLAERHGHEVRGLVLVNPSLAPDTRLFALAPVLKHVAGSLRGIGSDIKKPGNRELAYDRMPVRSAASLPALWRQTAGHLGEVSQPVLVYRSSMDHVVGPASMRVLQSGLPPALLTIRTCDNSYHLATLDNDAQLIFAGSLDFVRMHCRDGTWHGDGAAQEMR
ncbi:MAG TPA: alpha/beta fold hydrolase [Streptosporangiaceae bacterium]|nr:alpha/beta fold hydrolase [Streptosporangiaceae bacterium]